MGATVLHKYQNTIAEAGSGGATGIVGPNEWNDGHAVYLDVNHQTGTTYAIDKVADLGTLITFSNTAAVAVTIGDPVGTPPAIGSAIDFRKGWFCYMRNLNTGDVTVTPATTQINSKASFVLHKDQAVLFVTDGTNWLAVLHDRMVGSAETALQGDQTVSNLTTSINDWALTNIGIKTVFHIGATTSVQVSGISSTGVTPGQVIVLINETAQLITLKANNSASASQNRFAIAADIPLAQNQSVMLWYDPTNSVWRQAAGAGSGSGGGSAYVAFRYSATAAQTVFSGADLNTLTLNYTVGSLLVFVNGDLMTSGVDYTATNGSTVTFAAGLMLGDEVLFIALTAGSTTSFNTATQYQFAATGGQTVFTGADVNGATLATNGFFTMVHQNGRLLAVTADYTMTSSTVTLTSGANVGDTISIVTINTNNLSGVTQSALDNSTAMATTAYVDRLYESASNLGLNSTQQGNARAQLGMATGHVPGIATATAAAAGEVGEVLLAAGASGSLTSGTAIALASLPLTPGDWDISAQVQFVTTGSTSITDYNVSISLTSASIASPISGSVAVHERIPAALDHSSGFSVAPAQALVLANTSYFLNVSSVFTGPAVTCVYVLRARRMR